MDSPLLQAVFNMDKETINIYNQDAESIAQLHSTLIPHRLYELINQYFIKNTATVDIGCDYFE